MSAGEEEAKKAAVMFYKLFAQNETAAACSLMTGAGQRRIIQSVGASVAGEPNLAAACEAALTASQALLAPNERLAFQNLVIGEVEMSPDGTQAVIPDSSVSARQGRLESDSTDGSTVMVRIDGRWLVDSNDG